MGRAFFDSVAKSKRLMNRVGGEDELFSLKGSNVITLFFFWTIQQGFQPRTIFDFFRLSRLREGEMHVLIFTFFSVASWDRDRD